VIDLHSHILPGLDDGSESMEESLEMLRLAAAAGTTDIAATPHANDRYTFDPAVVERKLAELREAAGELPRLHYGCEMQLTVENIERAIRFPGAYTIAHRGYLLVELSNFQIPRDIAAIFGQLMSAGMRPVVVHPERNPLLQTGYGKLREWVDQGCVLQVTAPSFLGRFGRSAGASAAQLVKRGLVHLVASDGHRAQHRPAILEEARRHVEEASGAATAEQLFQENPRCILEGKPVTQAAKRRWWHR
jgi:protein-tyrosine phosphatase